MRSANTARIWILDGQGSSATTSVHTIQLALRDSETPIAHAFLLACHDAFRNELESLSAEERSVAALPIQAFQNPQSLLTSFREYRTNAIIANTSLFLYQVLRYLAETSPTDLLADPLADLSVVGFSTGLFAASVIASAHSLPSLLSFGVEAFRLAFWLGLRSQQYAIAEAPHDLSPWSLVLVGATQNDVQEAIHKFLSMNTNTYISITAVLHRTCVTVSGPPSTLSQFQADYLPPTSHACKFASIYTLYHSPELVQVKSQVLQDIVRRRIQFPPCFALHKPLTSPVSGSLITAASHHAVSSLAECVIDMILLEANNFDLVTKRICDTVSSTPGPCEIVNIGPGNVLCTVLARALPERSTTVTDWTIQGERLEDVPRVIPHRSCPLPAIAIVGMAIKLPQANDPESFWQILEKGLNTVSEIPSSRFNVSSSTVSQELRSQMSKFTGNFIQEPWLFDNEFFRISPREARSMDPQQRILLQTSYHALESSGYVPFSTPTFDPTTFGTYIGVATNDYVQNLNSKIDVYYSTGTLQAFLSGKISFAMGFSGPSIVVDTACSSSMVAIHQACRALAIGDCNAALAGGVNVITSPEMHIGLDRAHFLSPTGQCKPWDSSADGYSRAEGCGVFVLKRLSDALKENDRILGVIRGIEVNQSGNAESITRPHVQTQVDLFRKLVERTGIAGSRVSVAEAHGTGTQVGDPIEMKAIRAVFAQNRTEDNPLHVTSVKASIGHAEAASGAASLAKLLLMFRHKTIPPLTSFQQLSPHIPDLRLDHTQIDKRITPWKSPTGPRIALLNNFGAAGSNVAMLLEEPKATDAGTRRVAFPSFVLGLSCDSERAVEEHRDTFLRHLEYAVENDLDYSALRDICYTATARRQLHGYRICASGNSKQSILESLSKAPVMQVNEYSGKVVFVFSGMGGQYPGMGARLYHGVTEFRRLVDKCHGILNSLGCPSILPLLTDPDSSFDESDVHVTHSAIFVLEYALASLWISWGVRPDAVVGHSLGEYAAMVIAGLLTLEDALHLVVGRGRLMSEQCQFKSSGMLAVKANSAHISKILQDHEGLSIACYNSSSSCVVGGARDELVTLRDSLRASGIKGVFVDVPFAQHTSAMNPISSGLAKLAQSVTISAPSIPMVSTLYGRLVHAGDDSVFDASYFFRHSAEPVQFEGSINNLVSSNLFANISAWIEIGPHPTCLSMLKSIPATSDSSLYLPSLQKTVTDEETLASSLSSLYCIDSPINWRRVFQDIHPHAQLVDLPSYPFARNKFWVQYEASHSQNAKLTTRNHPFIVRSTVACDDPSETIFHADVDNMAPLIDGHKVAGYNLCPASLYIELATASITHALNAISIEGGISLTSISFSSPLVRTQEKHDLAFIKIKANPDRFDITSGPNPPGGKHSHCAGLFSVQSSSVTNTELSSDLSVVSEGREEILGDSNHEIFRTKTIYDVVFSRLVAYSPAYQSIRSLIVNEHQTKTYAECRLPHQEVRGNFITSPVLVDTMLHAAGFVANLSSGINEIFICHYIESVLIGSYTSPSPDSPFGVYCTLSSTSDPNGGDAIHAEAVAVNIVNGIPTSVIARLGGIQFKKLRLSGFKSLLASCVSPPPGPIPFPTSAPLTPISEDATPAGLLLQGPHDNGRLTGEPRASISPSQKSDIRMIFSSILDVPLHSLSEHADLHRLGLDSLASIELHHSLCSALDVKLPEDLFATCKNLKDVEDAILRHSGSANDASTIFWDTTTSVRTPSPQVLPAPHPKKTLRIDTSGKVEVSDTKQRIGVDVREILATVLDVPPSHLQDDTDLSRLGLDSLMSIEARHAMNTSFKTVLPHDIFDCKTVGHLLSSIATCLGIESATPRIASVGRNIKPNPTLLQDSPHSDTEPLFLIHDGSGSIRSYEHILPLQRQVWGIYNPHDGSEKKWEGGIISMAKSYTELIIGTLDNRRRCAVGGWSFGGVVAFEVARQLVQSGVHVSGLILIDSPHPDTTTGLPDSVIDTVLPPGNPLRNQMRLASADLVEFDRRSSPAHDVTLDNVVMLCCVDGYPVDPTEACESARWLAERGVTSRVAEGWDVVLGRNITTLDIPGNHFEPFKPHNVGAVSKALIKALSMFH